MHKYADAATATTGVGKRDSMVDMSTKAAKNRNTAA